jgi:hypothetical protein
MPRTPREIGQPGLPIFAGYVRNDPLTSLYGLEAVKTFRQMRFDEPAAHAFVNACMQLLRTDLQVEGAGSSDADQRAAAFLEECLQDTRSSIPTYMRQLYSMLPYGWCVQELVYKRRNGGNGSKYTDGRVGWAHWGLRRQDSLFRWQTQGYTSDILAFQQRPAPSYQIFTIPLTKCIHATADDTEGSPEGVSVLRGMYRSWYIVRNLELLLGIVLERFGTGLPVFETDAGVPRLTPDDNATLQAALAALRQNEEAGAILPPGVRLRFLDSPGLNTTHYLETIQYLRTVMLSTVLADFISLGTKGGGSYALGKDKTELFLLSLNGYQDRLLDILNRQAVKRLFAYNDFPGITDLPRLTLPAIRRYDLQQLGNFVKVLQAMNAFHVTPADEQMFRKIADMVDVDIETLEELHEEPPPMSPPDRADNEADGISDEENDTMNNEDTTSAEDGIEDEESE